MPTYEYRCKDCGDELEVFQSFHDEALTTCPACGGTLRKLFGSIGITFKGSGFYKTDSRNGSAKPKKEPAESSSTSESSSSDAKTSSGDSKSDSKSGDGKASDAKSSDSKAKDSKSGGKAPVAAPT